MGDPRKPIEDIAAEEIAADEERSRGWIAPKAFIGLPPPHVQPQQNPFIAWLFQFGAVPVIGALVVLFVVVIGAFALLQPGGQPQAMPTAPAVAEATATPEPTDESPTPEPTEEPPTEEPPTEEPPTEEPPTEEPPTEEPPPTPEATPAETAPPFAVTDPQVDEVLDDGTPIDDPKVDIVATIWHKLLDRMRLVVLTTEELVDPASAADLAYIGSYENVASGVRLAGFVAGQEVQPFHAFQWQVHDGVFTIGRIDPETFEVIAGEPEGIFITRDGNTVTFDIPFDQLPPIVDSYQVYTYHRAALDDPMRTRDQTELIELPEQFRLP